MYFIHIVVLIIAYLLVNTFYFKMRYIAILINVGIYVTRPNVQLGSCKYCIIAFIISWFSVLHAGIKPKKRLAL